MGAEKMNVIGHDNVAPDQPKGPYLPNLNDSLKKPTPRSKLRGIYGFLPFGTGRCPTRCFLGTLQRAAGNDQVQ